MSRRPNVLIITTHDTGRHFGCYGVETVQTSAVDTLARGGYHFTNTFATSPVCSASRGASIQHEASNVGTLGFRARYADAPAGHRCAADDVAREVVHFLRDDVQANLPFYAQVGFFETYRPFDFGGVTPDRSEGVLVPPYLVDNEVRWPVNSSPNYRAQSCKVG